MNRETVGDNDLFMKYCVKLTDRADALTLNYSHADRGNYLHLTIDVQLSIARCYAADRGSHGRQQIITRPDELSIYQSCWGATSTTRPRSCEADSGLFLLSV